MYSKTQGLVLRETNYKEADKILTVLTWDMGKRTVKARGCRRKGSRLTSSAQLLVYSDMTLFEYRDYYTLNEADSLEQFRGIRNDLELLALSSYFAEVTEAVAEEGTAQPELLSLILNSMYALDKLRLNPRLVKAAFELRLACLAGYEPLLDCCAVCGEPEPDAPLFQIDEGILRCPGCGENGTMSVSVSENVLAAMRYIVGAGPKRLFSFTLDDRSLLSLGEATERFLLTQLDRPFGTLDFYRELKSPAEESP
jgi:DNA repair protein RecO (recombination protein O)